MENTANNVLSKVDVTNGQERSNRKSGKEEKSKRKDDKSIDQVMKALNNLETTDEKLAAMCKKYSEVMDENRKLQVTFYCSFMFIQGLDPHLKNHSQHV